MNNLLRKRPKLRGTTPLAVAASAVVVSGLVFGLKLTDKANYDKLKRRASYYVRSGKSRAKDFGQIAKLQLANVSDKSKLKELYTEVGRDYYASSGLNPAAACAAACEEITGIKTRVEERKSRIQKYKINSEPDYEVCEPE